jgi:hypothetical protein
MLLGIEAVLCVLLNIMKASFSDKFTAVMAFPFEQIGILLRTLSLHGGIDNIAAIVIYAAVSLLPVVALLILMKRRKLQWEDGLLVLMSAALFAVLYLMINPGFINQFFGKAAGLAVSKAILGGTVYSVFCGYLVLRVLRLCFDSGTEKLQKYMAIMLGVLNALFVYVIFGACFNDLLNSITTLRSGNIGNEHLLDASYVFLVLQFTVDALPYVFNVLVVFAALQLLSEMRSNRYSNSSVEAAGKLSRLCGLALSVTVLSNIAFNLLQIPFAKMLMVINSSVQIPILSIAFLLAVLLLARFISENKQLKDDNDMFI